MAYCARPMPNTSKRPDASSFLNQSNASSDGIDEKWAANNEQWWDWYLSLAHDEGQGPEPEVAMPPLPDWLLIRMTSW